MYSGYDTPYLVSSAEYSYNYFKSTALPTDNKLNINNELFIFYYKINDKIIYFNLYLFKY